jgi:hypothetical protein
MPYKHGAPKRFFTPGALLLITLFFASCTWGQGFFAPRQDMSIPGPLDLTPFILKPVARVTPVVSFDEGTYTGTVEWVMILKDGEEEAWPKKEGVFPDFPEGLSVPYRAKVTLTPVPEHYFRSDSVTVTHDHGVSDDPDKPPSFVFSADGTRRKGDINFFLETNQ